MLITDITVTCERGYINLAWEWADPSVDSVMAYYMRDGAQGDGSPFLKEEIMRMPYSKRGNASRELRNEWGLYTFTLVPKRRDGAYGEKASKGHIMLGEPLDVPWKFVKRGEDVAICFPNLKGNVPGGVACLETGGCTYQMDYVLTKDTVLLFPWQIEAGQIKICAQKPLKRQGHSAQAVIYAREPFDQAYHFYKDR